MSGECALLLDDVTAGYGAGAVLDGLSLKVPKGSLVALLGANGSGKTTTLRVASCLLRPGRGRIVVDDTDVTTWSARRIARFGVCHIPEGRSIFPTLTVRENLQIFSAGASHADPLTVAAEYFPPLGELGHRVAGTLSGGQQQMVALSRAVLSGAKIALLDEVSMGLAPVIVDEIFTFLPRLKRDGMTVLLVEQFASRALAIADYVYVLDRGSIAFSGAPDELRQSKALVEAYLG